MDHLAWHGSLALSPDGSVLIANAGSNTISVLGAYGDRLWLRQVISSGGSSRSATGTRPCLWLPTHSRGGWTRVRRQGGGRSRYQAGENIAAAEVETVLRSHPGVLGMAALSDPRRVARQGSQHPHPSTERAQSGSVALAELIAFGADRRARSKVARYGEHHAQDVDRTRRSWSHGRPRPSDG